MKSKIITMAAFILCLPLISCAGWRDIRNTLDTTERVDKLITNHTPPPSSDRGSSYDSDNSASEHHEHAATAPNSGEDAHFIRSDDYFIAEHDLEDHTYIYVTLAKMVTQPSQNTKDEGEFMGVYSGKNKWTGFYWTSRIASKSELKLGMKIILYEDNSSNGVYHAPKKKDRARSGRWFMAKITDMSDMYKGFVTVSGNYKVGLNNIRIPVRP